MSNKNTEAIQNYTQPRRKTKFEIVMYILSIVTVAIAAVMFVSAVAYIKSYFSSYGMTFASGWKDALQYILSNSGSWLVYAVVFFGMARITARLENIKEYPRKPKITGDDFAKFTAQQAKEKAAKKNEKKAAKESEEKAINESEEKIETESQEKTDKDTALKED